jgi:hypothetical protein
VETLDQGEKPEASGDEPGDGRGAVMAIKKVPTDACIRTGSIWYPVRSLSAALARHTKLVFCLTGSEAHPYSLLDPAKYGPSRVELGFFDIKGADVWSGDPQTTFLVFGYPTSLRSVEIDDVSGALAGLKVKMIATSATYDQTFRATGVHAIKLQRSGDYSSDGLSGGTVYHVGEDAQGIYCGFAGLVIRGGETSDILHFIDARAIYAFFQHQDWLLQNAP